MNPVIKLGYLDLRLPPMPRHFPLVPTPLMILRQLLFFLLIRWQSISSLRQAELVFPKQTTTAITIAIATARNRLKRHKYPPFLLLTRLLTHTYWQHFRVIQNLHRCRRVVELRLVLVEGKVMAVALPIPPVQRICLSLTTIRLSIVIACEMQIGWSTRLNWQTIDCIRTFVFSWDPQQLRRTEMTDKRRTLPYSCLPYRFWPMQHLED
mmetsp:Transcript_48971/g.55462  ORF Transcript_48971/g.55462 Transcript_48971/m.55462 type:complete len:209 (-) Transcript_48971:10244-10870(-)